MDPNAALRTLLDALDAHDRATAIEALEALREWLLAGGFLPAAPCSCGTAAERSTG